MVNSSSISQAVFQISARIICRWKAPLEIGLLGSEAACKCGPVIYIIDRQVDAMKPNLNRGCRLADPIPVHKQLGRLKASAFFSKDVVVVDSDFG